ncbi:mitochondrial carrier domain-containing protein [Gaertneriomyces semiglobifer]|nr:mitochondrial carrier domain-containing protein [Gaertneriomyces semiglobifer]
MQHQHNQQAAPSSANQYYLIRNSFAAGAVALSSSFAIMHPLDTFKTRMQAAAGTGQSASAAIKGLFTIQTAKILKKGFVTSVVGAGPQGGLRWATYEVCKRWINKNTNPSPSPRNSPIPSFGFIATSAVSAIAGDTVSSIIKVPREVITARLQTGHYDKTAGRGGATGMYAFRMILKQEGPSGLFRGFWSTTARDWPFMAILFVTYDTMKQVHHHLTVPPQTPTITDGTVFMVDPVEPNEVSITTVKSTMFGGIAGALAAFLTTPFDVIRTKIMTRQDHKRVSMSTVATEIVHDQRNALITQTGRANVAKVYSAFFTGGAARSAWWFCVCSMFFPIYERCKEAFDSSTDA